MNFILYYPALYTAKETRLSFCGFMNMGGQMNTVCGENALETIAGGPNPET